MVVDVVIVVSKVLVGHAPCLGSKLGILSRLTRLAVGYCRREGSWGVSRCTRAGSTPTQRSPVARIGMVDAEHEVPKMFVGFVWPFDIVATESLVNVLKFEASIVLSGSSGSYAPRARSLPSFS